MNANDGQTGGFVFNMPTPQLRDDITTVNSAMCPKLDQNYAAFQSVDRQWPAVDPGFTHDIGCGLADSDGGSADGHEPERPQDQCKCVTGK